MLIGEEATWQELKEALPRLEGLKAESGILQPSGHLSTAVIYHMSSDDDYL